MSNLHFAVIEKGTSERVALIMIKRTTIHIDDVHHDNAAGIIMMMKWTKHSSESANSNQVFPLCSVPFSLAPAVIMGNIIICSTLHYIAQHNTTQHNTTQQNTLIFLPDSTTMKSRVQCCLKCSHRNISHPQIKMSALQTVDLVQATGNSSWMPIQQIQLSISTATSTWIFIASNYMVTLFTLNCIAIGVYLSLIFNAYMYAL